MNIRKAAIWVIMIILNHHSYATTYYSAISGGNWNVASSWSTVTYGNGTNTGTYPVPGDIAYIGDGYTINITTSCGASTIVVGQGTSGILQYLASGTYTLTVSGSITIQSGAKFWYNTNNSRTHNIFISGNFTNNGTVDFYYDSNDKVNITFNSNSNSVVSGSGVWTLSDVSLTKSTTISNYLDVQSNAFENAIAALSTTYGTYIHNNSGTYNVNGGASIYTISSNVVFKVPQGTLNFSSAVNHTYLNGSLYVNGGNVTIGSTAGNNGLRYDKTGSNVPYLEISGGSMIVYGGISYASGAGTNPFSFNMTGGSLLLNSGSSGTVVEPFFINDASGSNFTMSNGTIILQAPNYSGSTTVDFGICGSNGTVNVTGGTVQFGNSLTANNKIFNFIPFANVVQPNFKITGTTAYSIKLQPSANSTVDAKLLSIYIDAGKTFDIRSISGTAGDSKTITLTKTYDGTNAFYNDGTFTSRNGTITFNASTDQTISGSVTTTFYNLAINSSSNVILNTPVNISNSLMLTSGKLISSSTNIITSLSGASSNLGSSSSFIDGPFIQSVATSSPVTINLPIGTGGNFHPLVLSVQHTNSTAVNYKAEMINSPASGLGLGLPVSLSKVSDIRYYLLNRQAVSNLSQASLKIYYYSDDIVTDYTNLRVAEDDGTSSWVNLSGTGTANGTGTITSANFTSFNTKFSLANAIGGTNPLPVTLLEFAAQYIDSMTKLKWTVASEINTDFYTVERSYNGEEYMPVCRIKSRGNSSARQNYTASDNPCLRKKIYYRLINTDLNGETTTSTPVIINMADQPSVDVYPNPCRGNQLNIKPSRGDNQNYKISAYDIAGKEIATVQDFDPLRGEILVSFENAESVTGSACFIHIASGTFCIRKKIIFTK